MKADQTQWMQRFIDEASAPFIEAGQGPGAPAGNPVLVNFGAVLRSLTSLRPTSPPCRRTASSASSSAPLRSPRRGTHSRLRVTGNELACKGDTRGSCGPALLVWGTDNSTDTSALISDNRMSASLKGPVAVLLRAPIVVTIGNLVCNATRGGMSLGLVGAANVAVSGNLLRGLSLLPRRPSPSGNPPGSWAALNTEVI